MSAEDEVQRIARGRRWAVVIVLCVGQLMILLDSTVVNVALPVIQRQLDFSPASLAWVVNAYLLTFGGFLLLAGRLGDLIGRSRVFLFGLGAFTLASTVCGLSPSADVLVAARFVQGATAAMVASMVLGIISPMFPLPRERTLALSVFAFVAIGGASLGLVVGGIITELLSWHWIFFINVPVGVVALVAGCRLLDPQPGIGLDKGADLVGAVLVTGAPALAVLGFVNAGDRSWGSPLVAGPLAGSAVTGILFVVVESIVATPLLPGRIFRHRNLTSAAVVRTLFPMGGFGLNFIGALYLQQVLRYSPIRTGLAFLPSSATTGIISLAVTPWLTRRFPLKALTIVGLVLITSGLFALHRIGIHSSYVADLLPTMLLTGTGFGLLFMPTVSIAMADVAPEDTGAASGVANVSVQLGASLGVAVLATVSAGRSATLLARHVSNSVALTDGYRLALMVAAGFTSGSLLFAVLLLRNVDPLVAAPALEAVAPT